MVTRVEFDFPAARVRTFETMPGRSTFRSLIAWIAAAAARWHQRRLLEQFDERMLRDIGISRSQALSEANKPWWRQ